MLSLLYSSAFFFDLPLLWRSLYPSSLIVLPILIFTNLFWIAKGASSVPIFLRTTLCLFAMTYLVKALIFPFKDETINSFLNLCWLFQLLAFSSYIFKNISVFRDYSYKIINLFFALLCLNLFLSIPGTYLNKALLESTSYSQTTRLIDATKAIGIFNSPGQLTVVVSFLIIFFYFVKPISSNIALIRTISIFLGLILLVLIFSRFSILLIGTIAILLFFGFAKILFKVIHSLLLRSWKKYVIYTFLLGPMLYFVCTFWLSSDLDLSLVDYIDVPLSRLALTDISSDPRLTGDNVGVGYALNHLNLTVFLIGSSVNMNLNPHNFLAYQLCQYGIIPSIATLFLYGNSLHKFYQLYPHIKLQSLLTIPIFFGAIAASAVLFVEAIANPLLILFPFVTLYAFSSNSFIRQTACKA